MQNVLVHVAIAKAPKYPFQVSGDTLEMIERPHGGFSFVLADGQGHGPAAKALSHLVATKAVTLLADGVRDGAAARATHDFLYAQRRGKVSTDLTIVSVDLASKTVVLSRNNVCPLVVISDGEPRLLDEPSQPIGIYARTKPVVTELPLAAGLAIIVISDGVLEAGARYGQRLDLLAAVRDLLGPTSAAQSIADGLLAHAASLDRQRPQDDASVLVLTVTAAEADETTRRLQVAFPMHV